MKKITTISIQFFLVFVALFFVATPFARAQYFYPYTNYSNTTTNSYYDTMSWQYQTYPSHYYPDQYYVHTQPYYYPDYGYNYNNYNNTPIYYYGGNYGYQTPYLGNHGYSQYNSQNPVVGYYGSSNSSSEGEPEVRTRSAQNITENTAQLRGSVDMQDFRNGRVFFVYGEDQNDIDDVEDEDKYNDVDENGDDIQKILLESDLDDEEDYSRTVYGLDDDTRIYFRICVEYEDDDDDDTLECGRVEDFRTED